MKHRKTFELKSHVTRCCKNLKNILNVHYVYGCSIKKNRDMTQNLANIKCWMKRCFSFCSVMFLQQRSFCCKWVIETGSSAYQLHSGEQRARSGNNHTTWTAMLCQGECVFAGISSMGIFDEDWQGHLHKMNEPLNFSTLPENPPEFTPPLSF